MEELLKLDAVAFVRFASVYREFDSPQEFAKVVATIKRSKHDVRNPGVAASIVRQLA
jgi:transcriptional regulator NrdR family protein